MEELRGSTITPMAEREIPLLEYRPVENILSIGVSSLQLNLMTTCLFPKYNGILPMKYEITNLFSYITILKNDCMRSLLRELGQCLITVITADIVCQF